MLKRGLLLGYTLRKELRGMQKILIQGSFEEIGDKYLYIHELYTKVRDKKHFSSDFIKIQETMQKQLEAKKQIQKLIKKASSSDTENARLYYIQIHTKYSLLPQKEQGSIFPQIVHLRQKLEGWR